MRIVATCLVHINILFITLVCLIVSPALLLMGCSVIAIRYLQTKTHTDEEKFKEYCWNLYVYNASERSDEGEELITFHTFMEKYKDFLKNKYKETK